MTIDEPWAWAYLFSVTVWPVIVSLAVVWIGERRSKKPRVDRRAVAAIFGRSQAS